MCLACFDFTYAKLSARNLHFGKRMATAEARGCHPENFVKFLKTPFLQNTFIYLLYLTLVYKIVKNNSTNKYQQYQVKI